MTQPGLGWAVHSNSTRACQATLPGLLSEPRTWPAQARWVSILLECARNRWVVISLGNMKPWSGSSSGQIISWSGSLQPCSAGGIKWLAMGIPRLSLDWDQQSPFGIQVCIRSRMCSGIGLEFQNPTRWPYFPTAEKMNFLLKFRY